MIDVSPYISKPEYCTGCMSCVAICPVDAIFISENNYGFDEPIINESRCIGCRLCSLYCPAIIMNRTMSKNLKVIALKRKNTKKRKESQSGGAAALFAEQIINDGGSVYGVANTQDNIVSYVRVDKVENLSIIKKSKYVQAKISKDIFQNIYADVNRRISVLFCGTPCQVAGVIQYLLYKNCNLDNFYTLDFICHGVPSPKLFQDYLLLISENKEIIQDFNFRDKRFGWHDHVCSWKSNGHEYFSRDYVNLYYSHLELRESCYNCIYASVSRVSDITVGDAWGVENKYRWFDDNNGVSVIIVNSSKGLSLYSKINEAEIIDIALSDLNQPNFYAPTQKPGNYIDFWADYHTYGLKYCLSKYCTHHLHNDKYTISNILNNTIRNKLISIRCIILNFLQNLCGEIK